jgi:hypothetical protein
VSAAPQLRLAPSTDSYRRLAFYIRLVADGLALRDHEVTLDQRPAVPGRIAECELSPFRQAITVRVAVNFFDLPRDQQRHAVVHELVHAHVAAVCAMVEQSVPPWMPVKTWEMFQRMFERDVEVLVDTVAVLLAPVTDLPTWED